MCTAAAKLFALVLIALEQSSVATERMIRLADTGQHNVFLEAEEDVAILHRAHCDGLLEYEAHRRSHKCGESPEGELVVPSLSKPLCRNCR